MSAASVVDNLSTGKDRREVIQGRRGDHVGRVSECGEIDLVLRFETGIFVVPEDAVAVVVYHDKVEVERVPLVLNAGELNVVQL